MEGDISITSEVSASEIFSEGHLVAQASQVMLVVKNLPASAGDTRDAGSIPGLGRSPEEEMTTHSSILTWRIPWTEEPGGLQSMGLQRVGYDVMNEHRWWIRFLYLQNREQNVQRTQATSQSHLTDCGHSIKCFLSHSGDMV